MIYDILGGEFIRPNALRMRAKWCQLCRSAWSSITNCAVTGAPKLSENGAARSNSSSVNARTATATSWLFRRALLLSKNHTDKAE